MKINPSINPAGFGLAIGVMILGAGCSTLKEMANIRTPSATVEAVRFDHFNFTNIGLVFDVRVDNPNAIPVHLAGMDYSFAVEGRSLMSGRQDEKLEIAAGKKSSIAVPVDLNLTQLYQAIASLGGRDSFPYEFKSTFDLDLPVLGKTTVPVAHQGELPVVKPPSVEFGGLKKNSLNLLGADLTLQLDVENPNAFSLMMKKFNYQFAVDGKTWAQGVAGQPMGLESKAGSRLEIPISLNFLTMGKSLYQIVAGQANAEYELVGGMDWDSSLPLLKNVHQPIQKSGRLTLR